jgi:hypothetical protein
MEAPIAGQCAALQNRQRFSMSLCDSNGWVGKSLKSHLATPVRY